MSNDNAFVYLWFDAKNRMFYLGYHKGHPDDNYTHSSVVMESFTKTTIPSYMHRRILATGTQQEMIDLENKLLENRKEKCWDKYYNATVVFPPPPMRGEDNPNWKGGVSSDPEHKLEYNRQWREKNFEKYREYARKYYQENVEKLRESNRKYYQKNAEKIREKSREYHRQHCQEITEKRREYHRQWYQENAEKIREKSRKYRQENAEKRREYNRKYYQENTEKRREYERKYRANNAEKIREYQRQYYARKKAEQLDKQALLK